jgi:hypothetical protein
MESETMGHRIFQFYWISPEGEFKKVGSHGAYAAYLTGLPAKSLFDPGYKEMYRRGYIRAHHEYWDLYLDDGKENVDPRNWNWKQRAAIKDYVEEYGVAPVSGYGGKRLSIEEKLKDMSNQNNPDIRERLAGLYSYMAKRLQIKSVPKLVLCNNFSNASQPFGKTGYYDHQNNAIKIYTTKRHPTDILRSFAHEVIHHWQNEQGQLEKQTDQEGYAQKDSHMRKKEMEAYLLGNIIFRDWQDENRYGTPNKEPFLVTLNENLRITNPTKLRDLIKKLIRQLIVSNIITSQNRELASGAMKAEDYAEEFAHQIAMELERLILTVNNKSNWENQPEMVS